MYITKHANKSVWYFAAILMIIFNSCKKADLDDGTNNPGNGNLGLLFATSAETAGVPWTPNFNATSLNPSFFLDMPPVGNQGNQGSCVSWSIAYAGMSFHMNRLNGTSYASNQQLCSPKYVYNQLSAGNCQGTSIPQNLNILLSKGVCTLADMPYSDGECSLQPNSSQNTSAAYNKIFSWKMVDKTNMNMIKSCIAAKYPIYIAILIDQSFDNLQSPYIWSSKYGTVRGGHAVTVVGYDDAKGAFKVQNSWGAGWKNNGFFWISYSFFPSAVVNNECYIAFPQISSPGDNVNAGLVLNLPFNGNANDLSGNNNNGIVSNATLTTDRKGAAGSAYKFGGYTSPGSITIPNSASLNSPTSYSLSFWMRYDNHTAEAGVGGSSANGNTVTSWQTIFYRGNPTWTNTMVSGYRLIFHSFNNEFGLNFDNGLGGSPGLPNYHKVGEWHHFVFSKSNGTFKTYKDGVLTYDPSGVSYANWADGAGKNMIIGRSLSPGNGYALDGALDDFRIYNRALTASEVQLLFKL